MRLGQAVPPGADRGEASSRGPLTIGTRRVTAAGRRCQHRPHAPPLPRLSCPVGVGSKPASSHGWTDITPSRRGGRLEDRGRVALPDDRLGQLPDALCAATLPGVLGAVALEALAVSAKPTPWRHQDTTTRAP